MGTDLPARAALFFVWTIGRRVVRYGHYHFSVLVCRYLRRSAFCRTRLVETCASLD